jgi:putative transcriptional regulator
MPVKNDSTIAIPADLDDPEDFDVSVAGVERGLLGRRLRKLRAALDLSVDAFAERYGIPAEEYFGYESVRIAPSPAVLAYLHVIVAEPETTARAVQRAA